MWQTCFKCLYIGVIARVLYLMFKALYGNGKLVVNRPSLNTIFCIGSGGHTTEMLKLCRKLDNKYSPRLYLLADTDTTSLAKIKVQEGENTGYILNTIPRSREVYQSYSTSVKSTLVATWHTFPIVYNFKPDVIFCNGPGTCVPICFVAFILRCLFVLDCRIIYVESICRVRSLSLTGKILLFFADLFVVQWPDLRNNILRTKYFGRLT